MTDIKKKLAEDQARWDALASKAREMAAKEGPAAVAACEVALGAGEMVRRMVAAMIGKGGPVGAAERAWVALQTRKARASSKARKAKAREERKRIRREAANENPAIAEARSAMWYAWASLREARRSAERTWLWASDFSHHHEYVAEHRAAVRAAEWAYAVQCAAAGAVPRVEA